MGELVTIPQNTQVARASMLPASFDESVRMSTAIANSKLFGCNTPEQAFALMMLADAEGLHPAAAFRDYHVIQGKPALKADAMLGRYQQSGGKVEYIKHDDEVVEMAFDHPSSGRIVICWDNERIKAAQLADNHMHKKYPRQMKRARCISEGVRASYPSIVAGVYTEEEIVDFVPSNAAEERPVIEVQEEQKPIPAASRDIEVEDKAKKARASADKMIEEYKAVRDVSSLAVVDGKYEAHLRALKERYPDLYAEVKKVADWVQEAVFEDTPEVAAE